MDIVVPLKVFRYRAGDRPHHDRWDVTVPDTAYVLDAIEAAWAQHDRTLTFRHACHHASCGSCAVRVNGREKLPCITRVTDVWDGGSELLIEPLRNFPVVSDLVVDVGSMFAKLEASTMRITRRAEGALPVPAEPRSRDGSVPVSELYAFNRFETCIECGICISACSTAGSDPRFLGPAGLAALARARAETPDDDARRLLDLADDEHGVWRCHSGWECTEACPQGVDPAGAIMALRRALIADSWRPKRRKNLAHA